MQITGVTHHRAVQPGDHAKHLAAALDGGTAQRIGPWVIEDGAPADLVALLTMGVRPTCLDAASLHGLWVPPRLESVHVFRPRMGRGTRLPDAAPPAATAIPLRRRQGQPVPKLQEKQMPLLFHGPAARAWPGTDPVPSLPLVLDHAARCLPSVEAAILFESAIERRRLTLHDARRIVAGLPHTPRRTLARIRHDAGSGTETRVRWWCEAQRIPVRSQVVVPGVARVDLLVGESWIIECDSREFHDSEDAYECDRARDLALRSRGYVVTRLTWKQVFLEWAETEVMLRTVLRHGDHRRCPAGGLTDPRAGHPGRGAAGGRDVTAQIGPETAGPAR
ncbi:hypothetical protein GCM10009592_11830 [Brachybacterium rhamnosum]|uniref:DUF559 domain-containing protein n=1 Tax=Brachybacterium rhamnosum TaxID=173361 RepID=A0ABW4PWU4_9MICO